MHPKAATLALAGLLPFKIEGAPTVRFMRPGFKEGDWGIRYASDEWSAAPAELPHEYERVGWEYLSNAQWDQLTDVQLNRAIHGDYDD
ncbi:TPA: hypothetical protein QDE31_37555 [Burkholderia cenocepacia]|nr:hypothetical protein [Burkholderia cenocepacia]